VWNALFKHLKQPTSAIHSECLSTIRLLSRDKSYLNETINEHQFEVLLNIANIGANNLNLDVAVQSEALKCLCNLVFQSQRCQEYCLKNACVDGIVRRLRTYKDVEVDYNVKFYDMKLLFLITALNQNIRTKVRDDFHGLTYLAEALDLIVTASGKEELDDQNVGLINEILKVLFNLTVRCPTTVSTEEEEETQFQRVAIILHDLSLCKTQTKEKLHDLLSNIINMLTSVPTACYKELITPVLPGVDVAGSVESGRIFENYNMQVIDMLLEFLHKRLDSPAQEKTSLNESLSPILSVMVKCVRCCGTLRRYVRSVVLPPLRDVSKKPEEGTELRNYLCRLLTNPDTQLSGLSADLLFVMCKENVGRMVKYTGYGNAAGLFANRGLLGGRSPDLANAYSSDSEDSDTDEYKELQHGINPVVGRYEAPKSDPLAGMSDEQKEHEAMKLVNLMDQLHRQGLVQPCRIGEDGRPQPVSHILELQDEIPEQQRDHKRKT
jgi:Guanine nucleotide exchange factor synembryn